MSTDKSDIAACAADLNIKVPSLHVNIGKSAAPRALVIAVSGSLDTGTSPQFLEFAKAALIDAEDLGGLILDIGAIQYISSTGVGSFTAILVESQKRKLPFYLYRVPTCVSSVMRILGFEAFFMYLQSYEEIK
jgi:anti-sigma B factor antagonist